MISGMISGMISRARNNTDYLGAVLTGYVYMGVNIVVQVLLVPLYLEKLGKYQFGVFMVLLSFINYAVIGIGWMSGGTLRILGEYAAKDDYEGFSRTYRLSKVIYVGYALLVAVVMVLLSRYFGEVFFGAAPTQQQHTLQLAVTAAAAYFVVLYDFTVERMALVALKKQMAANIFQTLSTLLFAVSVTLVLFKGGGLKEVLGCLLGGVLVARIVSWFYWKRLGINPAAQRFGRESWALVKRLSGRMGVGFFIYGAILLTMQADIMVIGWLGGAVAAAEFVLIWKIAEVIVQIIWKIPEHLSPYLIQMDAKGEHDRLRKIVRQGDRWLVGISLAAGAVYAALGQRVIALWVGPSQTPSNHWAFLLAGAAIFWLGANRLPALLACSLLKLRQLIIVSGIEVLGKLVLTFALFGKFGYLSILMAVSIVHLLGVTPLYRRLLK